MRISPSGRGEDCENLTFRAGGGLRETHLPAGGRLRGSARGLKSILNRLKIRGLGPGEGGFGAGGAGTPAELNNSPLAPGTWYPGAPSPLALRLQTRHLVPGTPEDRKTGTPEPWNPRNPSPGTPGTPEDRKTRTPEPTESRPRDPRETGRLEDRNPDPGIHGIPAPGPAHMEMVIKAGLNLRDSTSPIGDKVTFTRRGRVKVVIRSLK